MTWKTTIAAPAKYAGVQEIDCGLPAR